MEKNIVNNAYGYYAKNNNWVDQSDRTGYGWTMIWNEQKTDPEESVMTTLNVACIDASDEKDFTAGINSLWYCFDSGYIFAHNKIDKFNAANYADICDDN